MAADRVGSGAAEKLELPRLTSRRDEIGELAESLESMTSALFDRIVANEAFAADVAHELKNPLTSIRSAVETSERVTDPAALAKLRRVIASDVRRLDRLISDISEGRSRWIAGVGVQTYRIRYECGDECHHNDTAIIRQPPENPIRHVSRAGYLEEMTATVSALVH